ncbi:MAG: hydrogenase [Nitrospirae bacterium CG_4_9_14_3_um_filter_53_35]|nr:MAG: hydrogenase [Nitrospirae bacterium CG2_30_53_67]PIS37953.1 MAG: hydrogenase [Nitrospirae bacterium CG08_land_8_20_14_0_20_52_24]PIV82583.1 MAG: hydrogenase [Nitrospirae bacterium CG17_big_fil_post_rev_8_21_14_2_50_50_9]PIW84489.1 MAG: hydrogenase [Nitrospirae bacterium CG_4_8_14_3_um_filter_50_41]PIX85119.1 MAG: hydrogenase [Nitrospirae bacterium CG_4_10_14_3_um_filter_53_41]PJA77408.1 MAG: hydrogenase [Nitrospirae bacterium CG_4_9_14_3_um_filter_53_35]
MIYKVITKKEFKKFISGLIEENQTIGPKAVDKDKNGRPVYQFRQVYSFDEMDLDYDVINYSIKTFFLPFREELSRFRYTDHDWQQQIEYRVNPRVIVGVRACDINGLAKLDRVFMKGNFPSPSYIARRKNTFIIGMDHEPLEDCFCKSLNQDGVRHGFNLFCTDIGDAYYLTINSSKAFNFLRNVKTRDPGKNDDGQYIQRRKYLKKKFKTHVEVTGLPALMDIEFKSDIWKKWGNKCLNCGSCAMVCPTCYCYGVEESIEPNLKSSSKDRIQYSCTIVDFSEVAGGHNFRPLKEDRLKYRFYHHYRGFAENEDAQICVGCNRCGRACLAGINPKDVINDLRMESGE